MCIRDSSNASGVTRNVTAGIATALASGDPSDTWCTRNASSGVNPSVTVSCNRAACASAAAQRRRHPASASVSYTHLDVYKRQA